MLLRIATVLTLLALVGAPALALDLVYKKSDGKAAGGTISKVARDGITISKQVGGDEVIPSTDIAYVSWEGEPQAMKDGRIAENAGRLADALTKYGEAAGEASGEVETDASFLQARVRAKQALSDESGLDAAISAMEGFKNGNGQSFRYYEALALLGDLYVAKGSFDDANRVYGELESAPTNAVKLSAKNAKARVLLEQGNVQAALAAYGDVVKTNATSPVEVARRYEAMLGQAECHRREKKFDECLAALDAVLSEVAPSETAIQAQAYVRKGDCYREMNEPKLALFSFLHVDVLFRGEPAYRAEALYNLVELWRDAGKNARASDAIAELRQSYPNSTWARKLGG